MTAQHVAEAEFFPQGAHHVHRAQRARPLDVDLLPGGGEIGRHLQAVLADAGDAAGELEQRLAPGGVGPPKVVNDVGRGLAGRGVAAGLGELVILGHRAILVPAARGPQVHAYIIRVMVLFHAIFCTWRVATHFACRHDRTRDFAGDSRR